VPRFFLSVGIRGAINLAQSASGFHAVAPDMRGYGQSDRPEAIDRFTLLHLVGDMVGVLDAQHARGAG
jgi:pimeloyl-ACP methyl ester carboxylesterase